MTEYLFVDGNYLQLAYESLVKKFFGNSGDLDFAKLGSGPSRVFYYHALDDEQRSGESQADFEKRVDEQLEKSS